MQNKMKITVIIADDHMIVRDGIRSLLEKQPDIEVVAEADNGRTAVKHVLELSPAVIMMVLGIAEFKGIDATRLIIGKLPDVKILALSMYSDKQFIKGMLKAGASGYMLKDSASKELVDAIRIVADNKIYISPSIAGVVTKDYLEHLAEKDVSVRSVLTTREAEVLQLLVEGKSTKQTASILGVSIKTIESHRQNIMKKLNIDNIVGLIKYAIREGIIPL